MGVKCEPGCTCKRHVGYWRGKKQSPEVVQKRVQSTKYERVRVEKLCKGCGEMMSLYPYEAEKRLYHSKACMSLTTVWATKNCKGCGVEFTHLESQYQTYHSRECWEENRTTGEYVDTNGYVMLITTGMDHPLVRPEDGEIGKHRVVLYDKVGPGPHLCHWGCGKSLEWGGRLGIQADHLDSNKENNDPKNLVVSCRGCNTSRNMKLRHSQG